jgi:predicted CoA-binding protein
LADQKERWLSDIPMLSLTFATLPHRKGEAMTDWKSNLIQDTNGILELIRETKSIAVLGIKPESHGDQAAHYVPAHMQAAGYDVIPVPVYYPDVTTILGEPVFRKLVDIGRPVDMVNVFRRPNDIDQHIDDILAAKPKSVWFQLGIRNDAAAQKFAEAGIKVVQDRCLMVEEGRLSR